MGAGRPSHLSRSWIYEFCVIGRARRASGSQGEWVASERVDVCRAKQEEVSGKEQVKAALWAHFKKQLSAVTE